MSDTRHRFDVRKLILLATSRWGLVLYTLIVAGIDSYGLWMSRSVEGCVRADSTVAGHIAIQLALGLFFWYAFFLTASRSRLFTLLIAFPIILDLAVEKFCRRYYEIHYTTVVNTAFDTTGEQVGMYINAPLILVVALAISAVVVFYLAASWRKSPAKRTLRSLVFFLASIGLPLLLCKGHLIGLPDAAYALSTFKRTDAQWKTWLGEDYLQKAGLWKDTIFRSYVDQEKPEDIYLPFYREHFWYNAAMEHFFPVEFEDAAAAPSECHLEDDDEVTVVLYVVESFRADHTPFAGYHRNTIPLLSSLNRSNIIPLNNMRSFGTHTKQSLYGILSDADELHRKALHTSIQAIFRKHHYRCVLIENCTDGSFITTTPLMRSLIKDSCDHHITLQNDNHFYAHAMENASECTRNMYIIFDGFGHYEFEEATGTVWGTDLIDLYDETRLGIDKAAYGFIQAIGDKPAIVLIVGDHGESFGEEGRIIHGGPLTAEEQRHVFAMIWYSDSYARRFPEIVQRLRDNADAFNSHDQIFHTMPSMGGIHSSLREPAMDMTEQHPETKSAEQTD